MTLAMPTIEEFEISDRPEGGQSVSVLDSSHRQWEIEMLDGESVREAFERIYGLSQKQER